MEAKGVNGRLELVGDKIRIIRKGAMSFITQGLKGNKDIQIKQISSIQFKAAGMLTDGYIQFGFLGGRESKGSWFAAITDENTITFNKKQQIKFEEIKSEVEKMISQPMQDKPSELDDLEKLAELRNKGIITEEEFNAKKKQILGL